jgi:N-acetylmannosamine-6-phosphate 2-epimerase/N-acetylmannosamine kinase
MQLRPDTPSLLHRIGGGLVVSCQPVAGGPLDKPAMVVGFALAALKAGALGLRLEGVENVRAVRQATDAPIIGIIKRDLITSPVRITPFIEDVRALAEAGADVIAFDATDRKRPVDAAQLCNAIRSHGRVAMADISTLAEAEAAKRFGAEIIATTLAGYTGGPEPELPDFDLLEAAVRLGVPVIAEGCIRMPEQAGEAMRLGALAVVVGSAITRPEHITTWFVREAAAGRIAAAANALPVLGIDIGGSKTIVSLVSGKDVARQTETPTLREGKAEDWCDAIAAQAGKWRGQFGMVGAAVTGIINDGKWSALNPGTLAVPDGFPLAEELSRRLDAPAYCFNDAQAAAWGEHRLGAGRGSDLVFLTISTGIGGGMVQGGKLVRGRGGIAGSAGNMRIRRDGALFRVEDMASGLAIAEAARASGHDTDARGVFAAAQSGERWAKDILDKTFEAIADLLQNIQLLADPPIVVIGGSIGLAPGVLDALRARLADRPASQRPELRPAALGKYAGVIGAADLARQQSLFKGGRQ